jgi:serine/threonine-protein phosphatase PP1 catalytic subunit
LNVCGDIHGQFYDLVDIFARCGSVPDENYLFLGDYVDRGNNSIETITYLLALKVRYADHIWLLRGNHETHDVSHKYGFYDEVMRRYQSEELWQRFNDVFMYLPIAAVISDSIFCVHGGLSPELDSLARIEKLVRPLVIPSRGLLSDLLWSDPEPGQNGWGKSERGTGQYTFGADIADAFLRANDLDLLCRAHQVVPDGYEFPFHPNETVLTVFSAPAYPGEDNNKGAVLKVDSALQCSFTIFDPPGAG